jgi:hypothetical protein
VQQQKRTWDVEVHCSGFNEVRSLFKETLSDYSIFNSDVALALDRFEKHKPKYLTEIIVSDPAGGLMMDCSPVLTPRQN